MPRVCVFCGARSGPERFQAVAAAVTTALVGAGYGIVYGGGRIGLMGTVADAALAAGGEVIGVIPADLADAEVAHGGITELRVVTTMHERKALMAEFSDAFVALPGGFGTMEEFHEILTWRQLRIHDKPIVLFNVDGYYDRLIEFYDRMEADRYIDAQTRTLFTVTGDIDALLRAMPP